MLENAVAINQASLPQSACLNDMDVESAFCFYSRVMQICDRSSW
jgi:hypothetical protein